MGDDEDGDGKDGGGVRLKDILKHLQQNLHDMTHDATTSSRTAGAV